MSSQNLNNLLYKAIKSFDTSSVFELLEKGADPNAEIDGASVYDHARNNEDLSIMASLIEAGADNDQILKDVDLFIELGNTKVLSILAKKGADFSVVNIWEAVKTNNLSLVEFLFSNGADLDGLLTRSIVHSSQEMVMKLLYLIKLIHLKENLQGHLLLEKETDFLKWNM